MATNKMSKNPPQTTPPHSKTKNQQNLNNKWSQISPYPSPSPEPLNNFWSTHGDVLWTVVLGTLYPFPMEKLGLISQHPTPPHHTPLPPPIPPLPPFPHHFHITPPQPPSNPTHTTLSLSILVTIWPHKDFPLPFPTLSSPHLYRRPKTNTIPNPIPNPIHNSNRYQRPPDWLRWTMRWINPILPPSLSFRPILSLPHPILHTNTTTHDHLISAVYSRREMDPGNIELSIFSLLLSIFRPICIEFGSIHPESEAILVCECWYMVRGSLVGEEKWLLFYSSTMLLSTNHPHPTHWYPQQNE